MKDLILLLSEHLPLNLFTLRLATASPLLLTRVQTFANLLPALRPQTILLTTLKRQRPDNYLIRPPMTLPVKLPGLRARLPGSPTTIVKVQ